MDKALLGINLNGILMGVFKKRIKPDRARELIMEDVEQYAQQVSREVAINFELDVRCGSPKRMSDNYINSVKKGIGVEFDNWQKQK